MDLPAFQLMNTLNEVDMLAIHQDQLLRQQRQPQQTPSSNYQEYYQASAQLLDQTSYQQRVADINSNTPHRYNTSNSTYNQLSDTAAANMDILLQHTRNNPSATNNSTNTTPSYNNYYTYSTQQMDSHDTSTPQLIANPQQLGSTEEQQQQLEELTTPLISPAISPSFVYQIRQQQQQQVNHNKLPTAITLASHEVGFSPLSSPAIQPQVDNHYQRQLNDSTQQIAFQQRFNESESSGGNRHANGPKHQISSSTNGAMTAKMTDAEIEEQYEQLERAKREITQKLTALQQNSRHHNFHNTSSNNSRQQQQYGMVDEDTSLMFSPVATTKTFTSPQPIQASVHASNASGSIQDSSITSGTQQQHAFNIRPATPSSLMNMRFPSSTLRKDISKTNQKSKAVTGKSHHNSNTHVVLDEHSTIQHSSPHSFTSTTTTIGSTTSASAETTPNTTPTIGTTASSPSIQGPSLNPLRITPKKKTKQKRGSSVTEGKKQKKRGSHHHHQRIAHPSPRALKPLLVRSPMVTAVIGSNSNSSNSNSHNNTINATAEGGNKNSTESSSHYQQKVSSSMYLPTTIEDAERILATKSNYQNLIEGKAAALGIAFKTEIKSGVEVRRSAHKVAEQKRRDSLKEWFDRLRREVEDGYVKPRKSLLSHVIKEQQRQAAMEGKRAEKKKDKSPVDVDMDADEIMEEANQTNTPMSIDETVSTTNAEETVDEQQANAMKPLSKVLLLQYAYEYITHMKAKLEEKEEVIRRLKDQEETTNPL